MGRIVIKASDVAAAIGQNKFKTSKEVHDELWKRYSPETFNSKTKMDKALEALAKSEEVQRVVALAVSHHAKNSTDAEQTFQCASKLISTNTTLSREDKEKITEHLRSKVYTGHGTRTEDCTADKTGLSLIKDNTFYTWEICTIGENNYVVMGRVDRIEERPDGSRVLVEIKNRTKSLYKKVYPTEMIQVQTYLHMLDLEKAKLIEQFNDQIYVNEVNRDRDMWTNQIVPGLEVFCNDLNKVLPT